MFIYFTPCTHKKYVFHSIYGIMLSTNTTSVSDGLLVFIHCLQELQCRAPFSRFITTLMCILMPVCAANKLLTHHWFELREFVLSVRGMLIVDLKYRKNVTNFFQETSSGSFSLVDNNATAVSIPPLGCLLFDRSFVTQL